MLPTEVAEEHKGENSSANIALTGFILFYTANYSCQTNADGGNLS